MHVFITREFPCAEQFVTALAVEPMTAPADAFDSGVGLHRLAPGERPSASWASGMTPGRVPGRSDLAGRSLRRVGQSGADQSWLTNAAIAVASAACASSAEISPAMTARATPSAAPRIA